MAYSPAEAVIEKFPEAARITGDFFIHGNSIEPGSFFIENGKPIPAQFYRGNGHKPCEYEAPSPRQEELSVTSPFYQPLYRLYTQEVSGLREIMLGLCQRSSVYKEFRRHPPIGHSPRKGARRLHYEVRDASLESFLESAGLK